MIMANNYGWKKFSMFESHGKDMAFPRCGDCQFYQYKTDFSGGTPHICTGQSTDCEAHHLADGNPPRGKCSGYKPKAGGLIKSLFSEDKSAIAKEFAEKHEEVSNIEFGGAAETQKAIKKLFSVFSEMSERDSDYADFTSGALTGSLRYGIFCFHYLAVHKTCCRRKN
jgi:hypothetical protein